MALAGRTSDAIRLSRILCILGVVYVHAWTGLVGSELVKMATTPQGMLRWALVEIFGRGAVPLLGMIAGWLAVGSARRRSCGGFVAYKARTVLAPMVAWNALAMLLVCGAAWLRWIEAPLPTPWWTIDELFCLVTPNDINVQMPFLRDLFICMCLAPALARAPAGVKIGVTVCVAAWAVSGISFPLLLRPSILLFFMLGMLAKQYDLAAKARDVPLWSVALPFGALAAFRIAFEVTGWEQAASLQVMALIDLASRFATAVFVWVIAWRLARTAVGDQLIRLERYAFLIFCDHLIFMWLGGPLIGKVSGPLGAPLYPLFLLLQPVLVLAISVALGEGLERFAPEAGRLLSGGRLGRPRPAPPAPALNAQSAAK